MSSPNQRSLPNNGDVEVPDDDAKDHKPNEIYQHKKMFTQGFLDIALLTSNASQLRSLLENAKKDSLFYKPSLIFIAVSLSLQVIVGMALLTRVLMSKRLDKKLKKQASIKKSPNNQEFEEQFEFIDFLDSVISMGIFLILIINVFIAAFGGAVGITPDNNHLVFSFENKTFLVWNPVYGYNMTNGQV